MPGVHFFPYPLRAALRARRRRRRQARCLEYFERTLRDPLGGVALPAAVILEVVQGEGGVVPAPTDFVQGVRRVTRELDIPLIVDEVQCGCGRTGTWFAFEQHGIVPDVIVASKALGGIGMPIALILYDKRLDVWKPGAHIGTFRGNQLAFARRRRRDRHHPARRHPRERPRARRLRARGAPGARARACDRRRGARQRPDARLELADPATGEPTSARRSRVQRAALERGLIVELGGRHDAVVRLLPPLNVTRRTLDQALDILSQSISLVASQA